MDEATMTDAQLRDAAWGEFTQTGNTGFGDYEERLAAGKYSPKDGSATHWYRGKAYLDQIGQVAPPPPPPPPSGWVVAAPGSTGQDKRTLSHPVGAAVNLHSASDPMQVSDTVVVGGTDQAFLIQPGAPGRTLLRCEADQANADGQSVDHDHLHALYAKAPGITVLDFKATGSRQSSNGFSCRYPGFLGQRFSLAGFPEPLGVFADDETAGSIIWRQGLIDGGENAWISVDEAAKCVYEIILGQIVWTNGPSKLIAVDSSTFQGKIVIEAGVVLNGKPVTASSVEEFVHAYPSRDDMEKETRRAKLPKGAVVFV